ncbi:MAG: transporter substrate-binding domain-containing protein [Acinetobacter sp.]|nr:MAG: transporter substrate-binding domain-containing protein [Acinetobacter sp.]
MNNTNSTRTGLCLNLLQLRPLVKISLALAVISLSPNVTQGYLHPQTAQDSHTLTVVTVQSPSTVFQNDGFTHGFSYDLVRNYAKNMDVKLNLVTVKDNTTALKWVKQGKAQFAISTASYDQIENSNLVAVEGSCGAQSTLAKHGLNTNLSWTFKSADDPMAATATGYLCQSKQTGKIQQLASFYAQNYLDQHSLKTVTRNLQQRLPIYKASFKQSARQNNLDWQFLAAIGYQESYLNPQSVSPTGVRGVMMLTQNTAKAMGVTDRENPTQSIQGGAKYFNLMLQKFNDVPYPDRNWFALVAYNMGPGAVNQIQGKLKKQGKDPNQWLNLYQYLQSHQANNGRHKQAIQYVKRIRVYLEHIKTHDQLAQL